MQSGRCLICCLDAIARGSSIEACWNCQQLEGEAGPAHAEPASLHTLIFHNARNRSPTGRRRLLEVQDSAGSNPAGSTNAPVMQQADIGCPNHLFCGFESLREHQWACDATWQTYCVQTAGLCGFDSRQAHQFKRIFRHGKDR